MRRGRFPVKVAYVTGASRGLGRRTAELLSSTHMLALGIHHSPAPEIPGALVLAGDVADSATSERAAIEIRRRFGRLDLFVANAGIELDRPLVRMGEEDWDRVLGVNCGGVFFGLRALAALLTEGEGSVVIVSSILGRRGVAGAANYAASKAALYALAMTAARELAPAVRVNIVNPGYLATDMGVASPKAMERAEREHLMGRLASIDDAARLIVEVAGMEAVTGQVFAADGRPTRW